MPEDVALLLRRAGFGPTATELTAARDVGYAATLSTLLFPPGPDIGATRAPVPRLGPDPYADPGEQSAARQEAADRRRREQTGQLSRWWLDRMTVADHQAEEKLVFFWHGHWATSIVKVRSPQLMLAQQRTIRASADVRRLAHHLVVDPALMVWLDAHLNTGDAPNENLARELMELFLLGLGSYGEEDVRQAGRTLTGWRVDLAGERAVFDAARHDHGTKTVLGVTGGLGAGDLVDLLLRQPACPRFIASRLWFRYASATRAMPDGVRDRMVAAFADPRAMLRVLFSADEFQATAGTMVKQPVEWLVGAMRQLGVRPTDAPAETMTQILDGLAGLGQRPFSPPSVGGWPSGAAWLTSAAAQVRLSLAAKLARMLVPDRLDPENIAYVLGVDGWSDRTYAVLREAGNSRLLLTLALVSPEYLVT